MKKTRFLRLFFAAFVLLFTLSCTSTDKIANGNDIALSLENIEWEKIRGAEYCRVSKGGVRYHLVKIDLSQSSINILAHPSSKKGQKSLRSKEFAKMSGAEIAINTSPFSKERKIMGIHIFKGKTISSPLKRYSAIAFENDADGGFSAKVVESQTKDAFEGAEAAFGGFFTILKDGEIKEFTHTSRDARSAAGISENGRTLFLLCVEKNWWSSGLSYPECARIFQNLGADDAIELDGGSSTSLFVAEKNVRYEKSSRPNESYLGFSFN